MVKNLFQVALVQAVRKDLAPVPIGDMSIRALRVEKTIDPCVAPIVHFGLTAVEFRFEFLDGGDALQFGQMSRQDIAQHAVELGLAQKAGFELEAEAASLNRTPCSQTQQKMLSASAIDKG